MAKLGCWSLTLFVVGAMPTSLLAQRAVILVRHAEKESGTGDVALSAAGRKRADCLMRDMKDASIDAIYTTKWKRTIQTAEPLAKSLKLASKTVDANENASDFAKRLRRDHDQQCVLIVGHSNTIPGLIDALVQRKTGITIGDDEFDRLFILLPKPDGTWAIVRSRLSTDRVDSLR